MICRVDQGIGDLGDDPLQLLPVPRIEQAPSGRQESPFLEMDVLALASGKAAQQVEVVGSDERHQTLGHARHVLQGVGKLAMVALEPEEWLCRREILGP